ncbi:MAG: hypothetical protein AAF582_04980 [Pseudomonadota bacterium]
MHRWVLQWLEGRSAGAHWVTSELLYLPMSSWDRPGRTSGVCTVDIVGERTESDFGVNPKRVLSNRKDTPKPAHQLLLIHANTFRMKAYDSDRALHRSGTDEVVMVRDAERVAGGSDAL